MRFTNEQRYEAAADAVLGALTDPAFYESLDGLTKVAKPEVVERNIDGSKVRMQVRYRFIADLPRAARRFIDPERLTWIDDTTYDLAAGTSRTTLVPDHYPDRLQATARTTFTAKGDVTVRRTDGTLTVRVALVGGQVEKALVSGLEEHMAEEAAALDRWGR